MLAGHLIILFLAEITIVTIYIVLRNQKILKIEVPFFERVIRIALKKHWFFFVHYQMKKCSVVLTRLPADRKDFIRCKLNKKVDISARLWKKKNPLTSLKNFNLIIRPNITILCHKKCYALKHPTLFEFYDTIWKFFFLMSQVEAEKKTSKD